MPALPTNADLTNGAAISSVHCRSAPINDGRSTPVVGGDRRRGRSCGRSARSTSGRASRARRRSGSRPSDVEVGLDRRPAPRGRAPAPGCARWSISSSSVEPRDRHDLGLAGAMAVGVEHRLDRLERPTLDHRVGDDAAHDRLGLVVGSTPVPNSIAATGGGAGDRHARAATRRASACAAAPSVTPGQVRDLDPGSDRCVDHEPDLEQRVDEELVQRPESTSSRSPSTKTRSATVTSGASGSGAPSCSAADLIAAPRGSGSIDRIVSRWRRVTGPTLGVRADRDRVDLNK